MPNDNYVPYDNQDIAKRIVELRKARNWSSYQLALNSGIYNSVLTRIEKSEREPKMNTLFKIIHGLGVSPNEFFSSFDKVSDK